MVENSASIGAIRLAIAFNVPRVTASDVPVAFCGFGAGFGLVFPAARTLRPRAGFDFVIMDTVEPSSQKASRSLLVVKEPVLRSRYAVSTAFLRLTRDDT
jgi:hypothetical protein